MAPGSCFIIRRAWWISGDGRSLKSGPRSNAKADGRWIPGYTTPPNRPVPDQPLQPNGSYTFFEDAKSFDHFASFNRSTTQLGQQGEGRNVTNGELGWARWLAAEGDDEDQTDGMNAADAVRILEKVKDKPFFLGVGFHKPHDPFHAPKKYFDLFPPESIQLHRQPTNRTEDLELAIPSQKPIFAKFTDQERMEFKRAYLACTAFMDAQVGKILDKLTELDLWDNTIVIFASDHGYHLGEHAWWNKVTVFEQGARSPLIAWVPGITKAGTSTSSLIEFIDLYPTLADLCELDLPHEMDGESFAPILKDPKHPGKTTAYTQVVRGPLMGRSVRTDQWRYTEWDFGREGKELYAHPQDPIEYHNLADKPDLAKIQQHLKILLNSNFPAE